MRNVNLLLMAMFVSMVGYAQKPTIKWGEDFKLKRGSTDLEVVLVDKTGAYLQEGHIAMKGYFVVAMTTRESASLVKVDKDLKEIYRNDFNRELRGKEFEQFFPCQDKLYLIASDYSRRDKTLALYASAIDKSTGELTGEYKEVATFQKDEKSDDIDYKFTYNADSTRMIFVSSIKGKEHNEYKIQEFDKNFKAVGKAVNISNEFEANKFQLEDLVYTANHKTVLVGRVYDYEEGKKKKAKFLDFKNYNIRIYNEKGKQESEINTSINSKWLTSTKVVQDKNKNLILAAFYSNEKKNGSVDGLLVQRIDIDGGRVISTSDKAINNAMVSSEGDDKDDDDDKDDTKEEKSEKADMKKEKDESEGFSRYMQFSKIFFTADNSLVILAEHYHHYEYVTYSSGTGAGVGVGSPPTYHYIYENGNLLMCKVDTSGTINWLQVLPKYQKESIKATGSGSGNGLFSVQYNYFEPGNRPFYAGFGAMQTDNSIQIFLNDSPKNLDVTKSDQKPKRIFTFSKTDCDLITLDVATGKITRKLFFTNKDVPTAMPRLGAVIGNEMYIVGKDDHVFSKTSIAVGKITVK
jgi:hypothetical protein